MSSYIQQRVVFFFFKKEVEDNRFKRHHVWTVILRRTPLTCPSCTNQRFFVGIANLLLVRHMVSDSLCSRQFQVCESRNVLSFLLMASFCLVSNLNIYVYVLLLLMFFNLVPIYNIIIFIFFCNVSL